MEEWVLAASTSAWALALLFGLVIGDGLVPIVPSEILLIAMATQTLHGQGPHVAVLFLVAFLGAFVGENLAYGLGAIIPVEHMRYLASGKGFQRIEAVRERLRQRGAAAVFLRPGSFPGCESWSTSVWERRATPGAVSWFSLPLRR